MSHFDPRIELPEPLSDHELAIAGLLAEGQNYYAIAELLACSVHTVKWHVRNIARKVPGDLPMQFKAVAWYRGATLGVLGAKELAYTGAAETPEGES